MASFFDNRARAAAAKASTASSSKTASKDSQQAQLQPWVEKYRPKTLADVASQQHTTNLLERTLRSTNLPHLLFYGPPGTGKTSTILALSKQLFGPELFRSRVLELNASDERGIGIVRTKIKDFARQQLSSVPAGPAGEKYRELYPCPPFKIIVLDEADSMTQDAQSALRRTMETYSRITRFCLVCNYVTRIIDPLASRCSKFRFKSLESGDARKRVEDIAKLEGVPLEDGVSDALVKYAEGDLRKAITFLQSAARLVGAVSTAGAGRIGRGRKKKTQTVPDDEDDKDPDAMDVDDGTEAKSSKGSHAVTLRIVEEIAGVIPPSLIQSLVQAINPAKQRNPGSAYNAISSIITDLIADGWSSAQLVAQLYQTLVYDETVSDRAKNFILGIFSDVDKRLADGADEHLTVLDLCLRCHGFCTSERP
ncbi:MAG: Subunit of heteropentameric Replication factor C (RF-C) [Chrysothrix sp. TS-e1954]|nr:MAG: Subunit of heteropentameric Replication factor C (RF-C) [Chrysothrix sp. TS-e1954]